MIVSFSVANFRSFEREQTLSMVASRRLEGAHPHHAVAIPDSAERALRSAAVYGANGAGKSNLWAALAHLRTLTLAPRPRNASLPYDPFRLAQTSSEPSSFDLLFATGSALYRYGIQADSSRITEERLCRVENGHESTIFERVTTPDNQVTVESKPLRAQGERLKALLTLGAPPNQSFLATVRANLSAADLGEPLGDTIRWFEELTMVAPDARYNRLANQLARDPHFAEFASTFLRESSTGVDRLSVSRKAITEDQLRSLLSEDQLHRILKQVSQGHSATVRLREGNELLIDSHDNQYFMLTIQAAHASTGGTQVALDLSEESDGTRRLLELMPALHRLHTTGGVYFIDEIDRSMHPALTWKFLEFFLATSATHNRQIIVTTHESNLLDLELLRRDEIWFCEKDTMGASRLYSLADYKVRTDLALRKHYLQGRFGAVPFLGNLDNLVPEDGGAA